MHWIEDLRQQTFFLSRYLIFTRRRGQKLRQNIHQNVSGCMIFRLDGNRCEANKRDTQSFHLATVDVYESRKKEASERKKVLFTMSKSRSKCTRRHKKCVRHVFHRNQKWENFEASLRLPKFPNRCSVDSSDDKKSLCDAPTKNEQQKTYQLC